MHDILPVTAGAQLIQSYGANGFRIGNIAYATPVLVTPTMTFPWSGEWTIEALHPILTHDPRPEIILFGTGARHVMLNPTLRQALKAQGFGIDTMDTGAACRTFDILLSEGRRVAAVLLLPA